LLSVALNVLPRLGKNKVIVLIVEFQFLNVGDDAGVVLKKHCGQQNGKIEGVKNPPAWIAV